MAQLTYNYDTQLGIAGELFDMAPYIIDSLVNEANTGALQFGIGAVQGTTKGKTMKAPAAASDVFEGVVCHKAHEQNMSNEIVLRKGEVFSVIKHGDVWVKYDTDLETAPAAGDAAYVSVAAGKAGVFTTASNGTIDAKAVFLGAIDTANGVAAVRLIG